MTRQVLVLAALAAASFVLAALFLQYRDPALGLVWLAAALGCG